MKHIIAPLALAAAALVPTLAHAGLDSDNPVHPLIGIGLTGGGDKLSSVEFTNGDTQSVTAGGLVHLYGGVEFHQKDSPFAFQATVGYHVDNTSAKNGEQKFQRWPIEAIALYSVSPQFRLGVGARYAAAAKFTSNGAGDVGNADFTSHLGGLILGEWMVSPSMGLQVRYVHETYKVGGGCTTTGQATVCYPDVTVDGSHGGVAFNYYF